MKLTLCKVDDGIKHSLHRVCKALLCLSPALSGPWMGTWMLQTNPLSIHSPMVSTGVFIKANIYTSGIHKIHK